MSQNSCCVPGCLVVRNDGIPLHRFPSPDVFAEKFNTWIAKIGGEVAMVDKFVVYSNRRVCHKHFKEIDKYPTNRLCKLAIPELYLPEQLAQQNESDSLPSPPSTSGIQKIQSDIHMRDQPFTETVTMPTLCLISGVQDTPSYVQMKGHGQHTKWTVDNKHHKNQLSTPKGKTQRDQSSHAAGSSTVASRPQTSDNTHDKPGPRTRRGRRPRPTHAQAPPAIHTLPGSSKPQRGPSGTGPVKRGRPDVTASPSTRVRVHSAQGEQRTYARATKDIPARLAVAICFPPPSRGLTKEEAEHIKTALEDFLMDTDSTKPLPAFRGYPRVAKGTVQMWCEDDNALTWLTQTAPRIRLSDTDLTLTVLKQSDDVPTGVRASLFVPRYKGDVARLQSILIRQNTWYDIARWSFYRATTIGGDNYGTHLTLGVPPEEVDRVLARERRISYLLGSIYVRFWPSTLPSVTKTDSTDETTAQPLTQTQTTDTEIAQLEVMARPTMEDDSDTLPPSSPT